MLKRLERRPLSGGGNLRRGTTPYDKLTIAVKFNDGIATAEDVRVEGKATRLSLTGTASVPAREYDLKGMASLTSAPNAPPGFELPFVVQGPWDDPLDLPRSGKPDPPLARCRAIARRPEGPQDPRCGEIGAGPDYGRRCAKPAAAPNAAAPAGAPAAEAAKQNSAIAILSGRLAQRIPPFSDELAGQAHSDIEPS